MLVWTEACDLEADRKLKLDEPARLDASVGVDPLLHGMLLVLYPDEQWVRPVPPLPAINSLAADRTSHPNRRAIPVEHRHFSHGRRAHADVPLLSTQ